MIVAYYYERTYLHTVKLTLFNLIQPILYCPDIFLGLVNMRFEISDTSRSWADRDHNKGLSDHKGGGAATAYLKALTLSTKAVVLSIKDPLQWWIASASSSWNPERSTSTTSPWRCTGIRNFSGITRRQGNIRKLDTYCMYASDPYTTT